MYFTSDCNERTKFKKKYAPRWEWNHGPFLSPNEDDTATLTHQLYTREFIFTIQYNSPGISAIYTGAQLAVIRMLLREKII